MAHDFYPLRPGFLLSIAGIVVNLSCEDTVVLRKLASRYEEFKGTASPVMDVSVEIIEREGEGAFLELEPNYRDDGVIFESENFKGVINLQSRRAWLSLSSIRPVEEIEYFLRVVYAYLVINAGGLLFHAAGIVRDGRAHLFFGYSGSGKTTVARLSSSDLILNDDLVVLLPRKNEWYAHATPFWNPTQVRPTRMSAPVTGLFRLVQDSEVYLEKMGVGQSLAELVASSPVLNGSPFHSSELIDRCREIISDLPVYNLHFLPDDSFWRVILP